MSQIIKYLDNQHAHQQAWCFYTVFYYIVESEILKNTQ